MAVIEIRHLQKNYGKHVGARDITFSVNEGEIFGFVGPNGAGKSTTIKALMGFIFPSGGAASIAGLDIVKDIKKIKAFTGYVPSDVRLYANMRVKELIQTNAAFYRGGFDDETKRLCEIFEIDVEKRFHSLSTGNRKKVSILCALLPSPKVIILDEPANGLDPVMQRRLFAELKRRTGMGATVLLSSHDLNQVQAYCDRVAFIKDGAILAVSDLLTSLAPQKIITVTGGSADVPQGLALLKGNGDRRVFRAALTGSHLMQALLAIDPEDFTVENESMEDYFFHLYGQENAQ